MSDLRQSRRLEKMNGSNPCGLFGRSSGAESNAEAAKTAGVLFPTLALSPRLIIAHILVILYLYINMLCILWWDA
jgi:hypothetical protein